MAAPRLSDAQKQEVVSRFRAGAGTQELAAAYGCSPNTVIRVVKAAIEPSLYEELKRQRGRRTGQAPEPEVVSPDQQASLQPELSLEPQADPDTASDPPEVQAAAATAAEPETTTAEPEPERAAAEPDVDDRRSTPMRSGSDAAAEAASGLAIDDADDFDAFDDEDDDDSEEDDADGQDDEDGNDDFSHQTFVEVPISLHETLDQPLTTPRPWCFDELPDSAYMLVDKTVELQARPLAEIPELGRLEAEELEQQALVLYSNPRQAKRHCGRTQRVIKVPDVRVLERTAPYLLRQGIRRIVVEGALYALPES